MRKPTLHILFVVLLLVPLSRAAAQSPPQSDRLGICYTFYADDLPPLARAAGSRWDRLDFRWNVIEDTPGTFTFDTHDALVRRDALSGINVIGILGSTASWATTGCPVRLAAASLPPQTAQDDYWWRPCPPDNLDLPWDDPANYWGRYVYRTVSHYRGQVHVWEMWNEPDWAGVFWTGTPAEYAQLLKVGYLAAKAADPDAVVLFGGLSYWRDTDFGVQVFDALRRLEGAEAHNAYFDALSLHLYSSVYNIGYVVHTLQAAMTQHGVGAHPIWLTETGVSLWDEHPTHPGLRYDWGATIEEAAAYVIESYASARAAGVEKYLYFRMHDDEMAESFGLVRNDRSLRPAYTAFQLVARYLQGENQITGPFDYSGIYRVTFWGTPRGRIDVLWNGLPYTRTYSLSATLPTATLVDHHGQTYPLTAQDGRYLLTLPPATAYLVSDPDYYFIGGPPFLLIQEDTVPPVSALHPPSPDARTSTGLRITWEVSDDLAGYWYQEIALSETPTGPWTTVATYPATVGVTQTTLLLPDAPTLYLRSRARDRVGNWEAWPEAPEVALALTTTVALSVTAYTDAPQSAHLPLSGVHFAWYDSNGVPIAQAVGTSWQITRVVRNGVHTLHLHHPDHLDLTIPFTVPLSVGTHAFTFAPVMHYAPHRLYLPLILR